MPHTHSRVEYPENIGFDSDGSTFIVDNSYNEQILSEEDLFTDKIDPTISKWMETIGGKYIISKGIGTVIWSWTDDEGNYLIINWIT